VRIIMKFLGRISAVILIFIIGVWLLLHTFHHDEFSVFLFSLVIVIATICLAWNLGIQFDKARQYYRELRLSKRELNKKNGELQEIFDSVDAWIWSNDVVNNRVFVSKGIEKLSGYSVQRFYEDYSFWTSIFHPDDSEIGLDFYQKILNGLAAQAEIRFIKADGDPIWVHISGKPIFDEDNNLIKINGVVVDITGLKETESQLQESEARYRSVVEISPNLIIIHQDDEIVFANPAAAKIAGVNQSSDLIGKSIFDFIDPSHKDLAKSRINDINNSVHRNDYTEYKLVRPDGSLIFVEFLGSQIMYNGKPAILVVGSNITAKKEYKEKIEYMAFHDALTGLPNRHMYNATLEKALLQSNVNNEKLAVIYLDLDQFKFINDSLGHVAGDELLKQVSLRILSCVREGDMVSRQGGDEFMILMENTNQEMIRQVCDQIIDSFTTPFMIKNRAFYTSTSIGISLYPEHAQDKESLNSKADIAMYAAKNKGKNNYQFYLQEQEDILKRINKLERDMRTALDKNEFYLEYQPKVNLVDGKMYGVEALVRWKHKELGLISPVEFISIAEKSGMIVPLGKWVLQTACRQNKEWAESNLHLKMSVNVSPLQFEDKRFLEMVKQTLKDTQLSPESLTLEITESVMQNMSKSSGIINELKKIGVEISIDDFGTGYSSLSVLSKLTIDVLKVDKSFINEVNANANTASLVKTIIEMGKNLNFRIIAEGIETKEQADFLIQNECYLGQGYLFSPPVPPSEIWGMTPGSLKR
jgi:diguanylate cyclase (GGDEF)-like protein/PAS domain S-box-containing protein